MDAPWVAKDAKHFFRPKTLALVRLMDVQTDLNLHFTHMSILYLSLDTGSNCTSHR